MDMADMAGAMDAAAGGAMGAADMTAMGKDCLNKILYSLLVFNVG